jgi:hypothetical protein
VQLSFESAFEAKRVEDDVDRAQHHRRFGDQRVQQTEHGQRNGQDVVAHRPEQVLPDLPEGHTGEQHSFHDAGKFTFIVLGLLIVAVHAARLMLV